MLAAVGCASGPIDPGGNSVAIGGSGGGSGSAGKPGGSSGSSQGATGGTVAGAGSVGGASAAGGTGGSVGGSAGLGTGGSDLGGAGAGAVSGAGSVGGSAGVGGDVAGGSAGLGAGGMVVDPCATVTCGADQTCVNGACMCNAGLLCGTACVDNQNDAMNCGTCGNACMSGGSCVDGTCVNPNCGMMDTQVRNGHVTHYTLATSMVACHYPTETLPQYYGAMNEYDWNKSGVCGACVEITNGGNKLVVQIVDQCPYKGNEQWCFEGSHHIDLNNNANGALNAGSNPAVTWKYAPCTTMGNMNYYFDSASQQYYLAVTPMNHRNPVAKMEVKKGAAFAVMEHSEYNTYVMDGGIGGDIATPMTFRITDIYNHVVTDTVTMQKGQVVTGNVQFAACP